MSCVYPHCATRRKNPNSKHLKIFAFPRNDKERAIQWARNCSRPDLVDYLSKGGIYQTYRGICTLHFERPCFNNDLETSLTRFAVPTIFQTREETDVTRLFYKSTYARKLSSSSSETIPGKADHLNSNTNELHAMTVETFAKTASTIKHTSKFTNLSKSDLAAHVDPSEGIQELFYSDGDSMSSTIALLSTSEEHSLTQAPFDVDKDPSKELLCRLCAKPVGRLQMVHIFGKLSSSKEYLRKMNQLLPSSEQPAENDCLPKWICNMCCERLDYCDQAIQDFISASIKLNRLVSHTKQDQAVINNSHFAPKQGDVMQKLKKMSGIKKELLPQEQCEEGFCHILHANSQQIDSTGNPEPRPTSRKTRKLCPSMFMDNNDLPVLQFMGSQGKNSFPDKSMVFVNKVTTNSSNAFADTSKIEHEIKFLKKPLLKYIPVPSESQDCSLSESVLLEDIIDSNNKVSCSTKIVKLKGVNEAGNFHSSKSLATDEKRLRRTSAKSSQSKKRKQVIMQEEFEGKLIQSSHTMISTANDNKTFLCGKCDMSFDSVESVLTHRFKVHPKECFVQNENEDLLQ